MQQQTAEQFEPRRLARATDPATSHEAAGQVGEFGARHHSTILTALRQLGDGNAHEIAAHCGMLAHAVGKRLEEMRRLRTIEPVIEDGKHVTRRSPSGRSARVWKAAAA